MRYFLICDRNDTYTGLRLAGITGVITQDAAEVRAAIEQAVQDPEVAVLIISESLASLCRDRIADLRLNASRPLVAEIPGREGSLRPRDIITGYIRDAIGVKLD